MIRSDSRFCIHRACSGHAHRDRSRKTIFQIPHENRKKQLTFFIKKLHVFPTFLHTARVRGKYIGVESESEPFNFRTRSEKKTKILTTIKSDSQFFIHRACSGRDRIRKRIISMSHDNRKRAHMLINIGTDSTFLCTPRVLGPSAKGTNSKTT